MNLIICDNKELLEKGLRPECPDTYNCTKLDQVRFPIQWGDFIQEMDKKGFEEPTLCVRGLNPCIRSRVKGRNNVPLFFDPQIYASLNLRDRAVFNLVNRQQVMFDQWSEHLALHDAIILNTFYQQRKEKIFSTMESDDQALALLRRLDVSADALEHVLTGSFWTDRFTPDIFIYPSIVAVHTSDVWALGYYLRVHKALEFDLPDTFEYVLEQAHASHDTTARLYDLVRDLRNDFLNGDYAANQGDDDLLMWSPLLGLDFPRFAEQTIKEHKMFYNKTYHVWVATEGWFDVFNSLDVDDDEIETSKLIKQLPKKKQG